MSGEFPMKFIRSRAISSMRLPRRIESPERICSSIEGYSGLPSSRCLPMSPLKSRRAVFGGWRISLVLSVSCWPKVKPSIVIFSKIFVVNLSFGPPSSNAEISQYTGSVSDIVYTYLPIAFRIRGTGNFLSIFCIPGRMSIDSLFPSENPRIRVIIQDRPDVLCRQIIARALALWDGFISHVALQWPRWLGAGSSVISALPLRSFYSGAG
jgi:hypothetical protein